MAVPGRKVIYNIATVFGLGRLPLAPGTWGSLAGLFLCVLLHGHPVLYVMVFLCSFALGVFTASRVEADSGQKDPKYVVIDEFACMFPVFFLIPSDPFYFLAGFCVFRAFDILKPPPIRKIEKLGSGWGIMLDDLLAAVYANIVLHLMVYFL